MAGTKRPYKVTYHYETGTNGGSSSHSLCRMRNLAREISGRGGSVAVWRHENTDDTTSEKVVLRAYQPYEAAIEDLVQDELDNLMYGSN